MSIYITKHSFKDPLIEFVERKGIGHPDTLADALAERLSVKYAKYTLQEFGAVLHHNFDKVGLLGGSSSVRFGQGKLTEPIRVLLNGRASVSFGGTPIPLRKLLTQWSTDFLLGHFPTIKPSTDLEFHYNLSDKSSPGKTEEKNAENGTRKYWFNPRGLHDLSERKHLVSNDTSMGVGYAPYSTLELLVLEIEGTLNGPRFKKAQPWVGSDIKVMAFRHGKDYEITMCIPQIASQVKNADAYKLNLTVARKTVEVIVRRAGISSFNLSINTRDNFEASELYLTAIGSSIESGDEGLVGRGNRINGVISPMRLMSMEGSCGKNPIYHIGKVYYVAANEISKKIFKKFGVANEVALVSQSGRDLLDPWVTFVAVPTEFSKIEEVKMLVAKELASISKISALIIQEKVRLF